MKALPIFKGVKKKKVEVNYQKSSGSELSCANCKFKVRGANRCDIVDGQVEPQNVCDLVEV